MFANRTDMSLYLRYWVCLSSSSTRPQSTLLKFQNFGLSEDCIVSRKLVMMIHPHAQIPLLNSLLSINISKHQKDYIAICRSHIHNDDIYKVGGFGRLVLKFKPHKLNPNEKKCRCFVSCMTVSLNDFDNPSNLILVSCPRQLSLLLRKKNALS